MHRILLYLVGILTIWSCQSQSTVTSESNEWTIALGSCNQQNAPQDYWQAIVAQDPNAWIWLGDIIYGDSDDPQVLKEKYDLMKSNEQYSAFAGKVKVYGIWDDHDYGLNNAGSEYVSKSASRDLLFDFLEVPESQYPKEGAYQKYQLDHDQLTIELILLDVRYFRDALEYKKRKPIPNTTGSMLGEEQWTWLENTLQNSQADLLLIGSGIQVIPEDHTFEKWQNFPNERKRLLDLVTQVINAQVVFLSGDRHIAELSRLEWNDHTIHEVTTSGLTHSYEKGTEEYNQHRVGRIMTQKNFATIEIPEENESLNLKIHHIDGKVYEKLTIAMDSK